MKSKNESFIDINPKIALLIITAVIFNLLISGCSNKFKSSTIPKQESILSSDSEVTVKTTSNVSNSVTESPVEFVNTIDNEGNPIQLVINVGFFNAPNYVKLGQTTEVTNSEVRIFVYLKNKDLLSYQDAENLKHPPMIITVKPSICQVIPKNSTGEPNSYNFDTYIQSSPNKSVDVSIEKIYDKTANQILANPITFKLELKDAP